MSRNSVKLVSDLVTVDERLAFNPFLCQRVSMENRKTTDVVCLHQNGDRELWFASGDGWSLPMYVDWKHDRDTDKHYALVTPACNLYMNQALMMNALMGHHDIGGQKTRWIIPRRMAESIMAKAQGITPACYYKWPDAACPPMPPSWSVDRFRYEQEEPQKPWACESFISHVAHARKIPSNVVKMVLNAIGEEAPEWMIRNRKPLELGFCRIIAAPFRSNWKEIVALKCRGFRMPGIFNLAAEKMWACLEAIGLPGILTSTNNMGLVSVAGRDQYRVGYVLEAIPTKAFEVAANKVETERIASGSTAYVSLYEETVERLYKYLVQAMASYTRKAQLPFATVLAGGGAGILRFLPISGRQAKVHGVDPRELPVHIIPPTSNFTVLTNKSDPRILRAQVKAMLEMSPLPPGVEDMRKRTKLRELERSGEREKSNGVLMLNVGESEDTGEPMLPVPEDTQRRLE